ncbi:MAG TPA: biopolymer transporter ExbD [Steroidobacteraceae bacterium]|nr:biopolymer transporter ExbD [Steroidobacteraceae bacterium]
MKSKSARLVRRNHARYHHGRDDLNIVPMIDMMVILVFFLIFTAVFSKTNILQLNLPASSTEVPLDLPKGLKLEVIIRPDDIVVNDRNSGPLKTLANTPAGLDLDGLSEFIRRIKSQFPDMTDATILSSPATSYDILVQVMDAVRVYQLPVAPFSKAELFPDISIGDAPT